MDTGDTGYSILYIRRLEISGTGDIRISEIWISEISGYWKYPDTADIWIQEISGYWSYMDTGKIRISEISGYKRYLDTGDIWIL